jgi:hypothetical protein
MSYGDIALEKSIAPVILGIKHHAFGSGVPGCSERRFQIDLKISFGRGVAFPLHHAIGLVGSDDLGACLGLWLSGASGERSLLQREREKKRAGENGTLS